MADVTKILDEIKELTLLEVNDLVKALEEEFGVSAAAPHVCAADPVQLPAHGHGFRPRVHRLVEDELPARADQLRGAG